MGRGTQEPSAMFEGLIDLRHLQGEYFEGWNTGELELELLVWVRGLHLSICVVGRSCKSLKCNEIVKLTHGEKVKSEGIPGVSWKEASEEMKDQSVKIVKLRETAILEDGWFMLPQWRGCC